MIEPILPVLLFVAIAAAVSVGLVVFAQLIGPSAPVPSRKCRMKVAWILFTTLAVGSTSVFILWPLRFSFLMWNFCFSIHGRSQVAPQAVSMLRFPKALFQVVCLSFFGTVFHRNGRDWICVRLGARGISMALELPENIVVSKLDELASWCRKNSLWPMPFATACCGIELMATGRKQA